MALFNKKKSLLGLKVKEKEEINDNVTILGARVYGENIIKKPEELDKSILGAMVYGFGKNHKISDNADKTQE